VFFGRTIHPAEKHEIMELQTRGVAVTGA